MTDEVFTEAVVRDFSYEAGTSRIQIIWDPVYRRITAIDPYTNRGLVTQAKTTTDYLYKFAYKVRDKFALSSIVSQIDLVTFMQAMIRETDHPVEANAEHTISIYIDGAGDRVVQLTELTAIFAKHNIKLSFKVD